MKLTIITINRNNAAGLARTLDSTLGAQTGFGDWEQVVVDGASTDGSFATLDKWKDDPRLGWHVSEPDTGIYNAMNKGATHAQGDYLLFLNSGDELLPDTLKQVFEKEQNTDIVYGDELVVGNQGTCWTWAVSPNDITPAFFLLSGFPHQSCFISHSLFSRMNGYDESLNIIGDTEFLLRCRENPAVRFVRLPFIISKYYKDGRSSDPSNQAERLEERRRVMAAHFGVLTSTLAASLLSEDKPWISGRVAMQASSDRSFASFLRTFASASSKMWKVRFFRFLMKLSVKLLKTIHAHLHNDGTKQFHPSL